MPYITRDDNEHFVIPSYRDVLTAKQKSVIKTDVTALSHSYGELITMQRKGPEEYEVAFSSDTGYLFGETVWHHFDKPQDMIFCETVPHTTEALLVIVKNGSVYLDGSFPIDSISEELVVFLTQQNDFEVFVNGDVPLSETPEDGKFSFDPDSIKAFTVLDEPVLNSLPLIKAYHFQALEVVLKEHGIGTLHILPIIAVGAIIGVGLLIYLVTLALEKPKELPMEKNPYKGYVDAIASPAPEKALHALVNQVRLIHTAPGWIVNSIKLSGTSTTASAVSAGANLSTLIAWCDQNKVKWTVDSRGMQLSLRSQIKSRPKPKQIYSSNEVMAILVDRLLSVNPGNRVKIGRSKSVGPYKNTQISVSLDKITPVLLSLVADQLVDLPLRLDKVQLTMKKGSPFIDGRVYITVYGT